MQRYALVASLFFTLLPSAPVLALTASQKKDTCKFGADHPMLTGKARAEFLKKCMSDRNDPRGTPPGAAPAGAESEPK